MGGRKVGEIIHYEDKISENSTEEKLVADKISENNLEEKMAEIIRYEDEISENNDFISQLGKHEVDKSVLPRTVAGIIEPEEAAAVVEVKIPDVVEDEAEIREKHN